MLTLKIVPYEIRKILTSRIHVIFLLLLFGANLFLCHSYAGDAKKAEEERYFPELRAGVENVYNLYHNDPELFFSEYERVEQNYSDIHNIKVTRIYAEAPAEDHRAFLGAYEIVCADAIYHEKIGQMIGQTERLNHNIQLLTPEGDQSYVYRNNAQTVEAYKRLNETVHLGDKKVTGWDTYFTYTAEFFMVAAAITLIAVTVAVSDHKSGFAAIIGATKHGRKETAAAKFCAMLLLSMAVTLLFALTSFLTVAGAMGFSDPGNPVQAAPSMEMFPFAVNMAGAALLSLGTKLLSAVTYGTLLFALASLVKSYAFGIGLGFGFVGVSYVIAGLEPAAHGQWINMNFVALYQPSAFLARYRTVNLFEYAADLRIVMPVLILLLIAGSLLLALLAAAKHRPKLRKLRVKEKLKLPLVGLLRENAAKILPKRKTGRRHSVSLAVYELQKQKWLFLVLILLIAVKAGDSASYFTPSNSVYNMYRQEYLQKLEGEYSEEKQAYLEKESERLGEIISKESEMATARENGEITDEAYSAYLKERYAADYRQQAVTNLLAKADRLDEKFEMNGVLGSFLYDTGYNKYMSRGADYLLLLFLLLFCSRFYLAEQEKRSTESPMYALVQATRNGRGKLLWKKLLVNFTFVTAAFALFKGIDLYFFLSRYPLPLWDAKLFSISRYGGAPIGMTVRGYFILTLALSYVGVLLLSLLAFLAAVRLKRTVITYAAEAAVLFIPHFVVLSGQRIGNYIDPTQLHDTDRLLRYSLGHYGSFTMAAVFFTVALLLTAVYFVFSVRRVKKGVRL